MGDIVCVAWIEEEIDSDRLVVVKGRTAKRDVSEMGMADAQS